MPRKKIVRIQETAAAAPAKEEAPSAAPEAAPKPAAPEVAAAAAAPPAAPPPTPATVEPTPPAAPVKKRQRKEPAPKSRMVRRTTQEMKKAQEIEYMVTRIANELRKDGWAAPPPPPPPPTPQPTRGSTMPPPRRQPRGTKHLDLREVLRRHNVPNNYRRAGGEYLQQYEEEDYEETPAVAAAAPAPIGLPGRYDESYADYDYEDDNFAENDDLFSEPKVKRFVPKTDDKVATVYSQIFGPY